MGTIYYVACEACHEYAEMDKFYACSGIDPGRTVEQEIAWVAERIRDAHCVRAAILVTFAGVHMGHKIEVYTEHADLHDRIIDENADAEIAGTKRPWTLTMEFGTGALRDALAARASKEDDS